MRDSNSTPWRLLAGLQTCLWAVLALCLGNAWGSRTVDPLDLPQAERQIQAESIKGGWDYFGGRYYDPARGMWLGRDPKELNYGPFQYSSNNPMGRFDPNGNWDKPSDVFMQRSDEAAANGQLFHAQYNAIMSAPAQVFVDAPSSVLNQYFGDGKTASVWDWVGTVGTAFTGVSAVRNLQAMRASAAASTAADGVANGAKAIPVLEGTGIWSGEILSTTAKTDMTMYRVWGGESAQIGSWLSPVKPASADAAKSLLSLPPQNAAQFVSEVVVPAGTRFQIGTAGGAFGKSGGGVQVQLLDQIPKGNFGTGASLK